MEANNRFLSLEPQNVMITGATTPLGRAIVKRLLKDERVANVLAIGAEPESASLSFPDSERLTYLQVDLTRSRRLRYLLYGPVKELRIQTVIHAAMHRRSTHGGKKAHCLNVDSTRELLHLSEQHPTIKRFVLRSFAEVYKMSAELPTFIDETHPLVLDGQAPQWLRDRVEADVTVCTRMGLSPLHIMVLRSAECFAPDLGSQMFDYLSSSVCFRPMGYDPMLNLLSLPDLVDSIHKSLFSQAQGIFNIPGEDILPLSRAIRLAGSRDVPFPDPLLSPLYWARSFLSGKDFRYDLNQWRFHFNGVLDGRRAEAELGFQPQFPICWDEVQTFRESMPL